MSKRRPCPLPPAQPGRVDLVEEGDGPGGVRAHQALRTGRRQAVQAVMKNVIDHLPLPASPGRLRVEGRVDALSARQRFGEDPGPQVVGDVQAHAARAVGQIRGTGGRRDA